MHKYSLSTLQLLLFMFVTANLRAQQATGDLELHVIDPTGAALQATGTLTGTSVNAHFSARTDIHGIWSIGNLPLGRYHLEVSHTGFQTLVLPVEFTSSLPVSKTVTLKIADISTSISVVSTTPIGEDLPIDRTPVPVQGLNASDIEHANAIDITDVMNKRLNGVYINENANNPFAPDINYRGYTASPLLGTPQGLSIYLDGVRQNQPFGDVVNWDLIPKVAIQDMQLMPGSDPLFGLNTLGGAISVRTKNGIDNAGATAQIVGGYFGRASVEASYGGSTQAKTLDWFLGGNYFREDGWRKFSPSEVRQSFAKLHLLRERTTLSLSGSYSINSLTGNGLQDFRALNRDYTSVYTIPDTTWNHSPTLTLNATHALTNSLTLSGNAYFRHTRSDTTNGDINNDSFDQSLYNLSKADIAALTAAGYTGFPTTGNPTTEPFPYWRCIAQALEQDEPSEKCTGMITNTRTQQNNYGLFGLASWRTSRNVFSFGAAWDRSSLSYGQLSQFGYLNSDGVSVTPVNAYADGSTNQDGAPVDTRVQLHGTINTPSFFLADTATFGRWSISASGRYNRTTVDNTDRLPPSAVHGSLTGTYVFQRFNPSIGATYRILPGLSAYANYAAASRAPTSIELGCADPNFPCNLPNALVSDPPLNQVVSRTVEAGIRSLEHESLSWSVGYFRGINSNDLLFVASQQTGFGYFLNFGSTKREGIEANISGSLRHLTLGAGYTFLNATYQSSQVVNGGSNSSNDSGQPGLDGNIAISPGNRIPQTPQHIFKAFADYKPLRKLVIDANLIAVSGSYARGNENNLHQPDGTYYLGSGSSPAYATLSTGARYTFSPKLELFAQINNLTNNHYYTAAQLGTTPYDNSDHFIARPFPAINGQYPVRNTTFLAPGAPFTLFGGIRLTLHKK